ncbi:hypothetical protein IWW43_005432 [Coemansia sp. RSA 1935]|nr:hypothetical protein LPJ54_001315 [Coemansia sp. RSA 1824]KAJ2424143.1 hypothetical protein GGF47_002999 [Coemansia sp. RSA 2524]KAJ2440262.1 hypothetical protein IWW46_004066 [Coemansia sp. RSA 2440]KAJ2528404.1 hypothetical protein IWW43_005432 [Coemansia sp. RSA 1935]
MNIWAICIQLGAIGLLQPVSGQNPFDNFISNVGEAVRPAQSVVEGVINNAGNAVASVADQAGDTAASLASHAISDANSFQESQISAELSSYHSAASAMHGEWVAASACIAALALTCKLVH